MKRMAILMALSCMLIALGSFSPFGTHWGRAAVADEQGDDGDDDDGGDQGSEHAMPPLQA